MKFESLLLGLLLVFCTATVLAEDQNINLNAEIAAPVEDIITYTVKKGDTAYSIAAMHNTTVEEIYRLNPNARNGIKKGDKLKISKMSNKPVGHSDHLIEAKETLFSVSKMYNITVDNLKNANPGLDETNFQIGRTIRIPKFGVPTAYYEEREIKSPSIEQYKVGKGETLYSISKKHNTSVELLMKDNPSLKDGLKEGMVLRIVGNTKSQTPMIGDKNVETKIASTPPSLITKTVREDDGIIRIAILLPFLDDKTGLKERMTEYYQGFLLGVKELKEKGYDSEIYAFDIGSEKDTKKLESLLETNEMRNLDLIIGGVSDKQIESISRFSKKAGLKYVVPFGTKNDAVDNNPYLFQATTSPSNLLDRVMDAFADRFKDHNILFVSERGSDNNKKDFISDLKKVLNKAGIKYQTIGDSESLSEELKAKMSQSASNLLIPSSASEATLNRLFAHLQMTEGFKVSLFGYPEWQTYASAQNQLYTYDAYIYSIFFLDESQYKVRSIKDQYIEWYNKPIINTYPRFAYLGYDASMYFMTSLKRYGNKLDEKISGANIPTLQSATHFERASDETGFINTGIYFVHYKSDSTIEKIDIYKK